MRRLDTALVSFFAAALFSLAAFGPALQAPGGGDFPGPLVSEGGSDAFAPVDPVPGLLQNVSLSNLYGWNYELQNLSTRFVYSKNFINATNYVYNRFAGCPALTVKKQPFVYESHTLNNVIATLPGLNSANDTVFIVGGHYDSIQYPESLDDYEAYAPGADDDGSGTVATLELARLLSNYRFENTIIFAAWAAEELGLIGSAYFAKDAASSGMKIGGYLNLDMVGNDADKNDSRYKLSIGKTDQTEWLADLMASLNAQHSIGLEITMEQAGASSDHYPFLQNGYPAVECAETDFSPHWHKVTDTVANMNFGLVRRTAQLCAASLAALAGIKNPGIGLVSMDKAHYRTGSAPNITLYDTMLNLDPGANDTVDITLNSTTDPAGVTVTLTEGGPDLGLFYGNVWLTGSSSPQPGQLRCSPGDTISAVFLDMGVSPPEYRTAEAVVDDAPPGVFGVAIVPQVDSATVYFTTDEPTASEVKYGTASLSKSASETSSATEHAVMLSGLSPNTRYNLDIVAKDEAQNAATADNSGSHFQFRTLMGVASRPGPGYAYWVRENKDAPGGNSPHLDGQMQTGYGTTYLRYHGAFQMNLTPVPAGAVITGASVRLYGQGFVRTGGDTAWTLQLLPPSVDANFANQSFWAIQNAAPDAAVQPSLRNADLGAKKWNTFVFTPSQYGLLLQRLQTGKISFRIDGPTGPTAQIYSWDSGYGGGSSGPEYGPALSLTYTATGDTAGPSALGASISPNPTMGLPEAEVSALAFDPMGTPVAQCEYSIATEAAPGSGTAMPADDGICVGRSEGFRAVVNVSGMTIGDYPVFVRARDCSGNWGSAQVATLHVTNSSAVNATWEATYRGSGWHLASLPMDYAGGAFSALGSLSGQYDRILAYCPDDIHRPWREWRAGRQGALQGLGGISTAFGFWLNLTPNVTFSAGALAADEFTLNITGYAGGINYILLQAGWNIMPYPSIVKRPASAVLSGVKYDQLQTFNSTAKYLLADMAPSGDFEPGQAYWIHVLEPALLGIKCGGP